MENRNQKSWLVVAKSFWSRMKRSSKRRLPVRQGHEGCDQLICPTLMKLVAEPFFGLVLKN
jgi:hypothetical protein